MARSCWRVTEPQIRGKSNIHLRLDEDYTLTQKTTFGPVHVPLFAWREEGTTHAPARELRFPLHPAVRSSDLLLEWESRLGSQLPFRQAEAASEFFSHGAVRVEDTTISRHIGAIGGALDRTWTCRTPEDVRVLLETRATRDTQTGRPILYVSSDAHALRRYVDLTWKAEQKMINGIRLWCIDRDTRQTIHIGGEYTWGNAEEVGRVLSKLMAHLMPTGEHEPQVVFVSDGMPWFRDWLFPVLPEDTVYILDYYHLLERLKKYASTRFASKTAADKWLARTLEKLQGKRRYRRKKGKLRKGHTKSRGARRRAAASVTGPPSPSATKGPTTDPAPGGPRPSTGPGGSDGRSVRRPRFLQ